MNRRTFVSMCAAATVGSAFCKSAPVLAAPPGDKPFAGAKLRMSAPLDWFPGDKPEDKLDHVAAWGLPAYEWLGPEGDFDAIRAKADALGLELSCIVGAGAIAPGGMVNPADHDKVVAQFEERVVLAKRLNCKRLVGLSGNERDDIPREEQTQHVITCLKRLAPIAEANGVTLVLEALNPLVDHKGYFVCRTDHAMEIIEAVGSPSVKMLFDIYHQQITEGNVIRNLRSNIRNIGHFHVADNPGRKEPGTGELNYVNIFKTIARTRYEGFVALECGHSTDNYEDTLRATLACLAQI
ncbi:MAG: TIM barrel protein [Candidatus Hydrogenedentes bacterium]|nr:TIM barrel protein [Candidatus Hydrogenedentota bacterium]